MPDFYSDLYISLRDFFSWCESDTKSDFLNDTEFCDKTQNNNDSSVQDKNTALVVPQKPMSLLPFKRVWSVEYYPDASVLVSKDYYDKNVNDGNKGYQIPLVRVTKRRTITLCQGNKTYEITVYDEYYN